MRIDGKCNQILTAPITSLSGILIPVKTHKNFNAISMHEGSSANSTRHEIFKATIVW